MALRSSDMIHQGEQKANNKFCPLPKLLAQRRTSQSGNRGIGSQGGVSREIIHGSSAQRFLILRLRCMIRGTGALVRNSMKISGG